MRLLSLIPKGNSDPKTKHYVGLPPVLTEGQETRQVLGSAHLLVIEEFPDGIFLYRYGTYGEFVGDTWHMNIDDAKRQASYEYGDLVQEWIVVPVEVDDVVTFGLERS